MTRIESGRDREWDGGRRGPAGRTPDVTNATNMLLTAHRSPLAVRCSLLVYPSIVPRRPASGRWRAAIGVRGGDCRGHAAWRGAGR
ncbi:hypothetical protein ACX84Q_35060, partial [Burkholderia pseudomallei]